MAATALGPGDGERHEMGPTSVTIKATADDTDMFYVLEGALTVRLGNETRELENYMRDLAAASASGTPPTPEEIGKIASRYDFRLA